MTTKDIEQRLAAIRQKADSDPEAAHSLRDKLYVDVLKHIAEGSNTLAKAALKAQRIKLRWDVCA